MIRNLKTNGDAEKKLMLLKESLQLAIKNDEAISASRAGFQQGKPLEISVDDNKTLAERIADTDQQLADARTNLMQVFKTAEVFAIMGLLDKDQIITINTLWAGMKKELEKVNTKLMTPQDFLLFLNKYTESAVSLQGALNVGINDADELEEIVPSPQDMKKLLDFLLLRETPRNRYLQQVAFALSNALPTVREFNKIFDLPAITAKNKVEELLTIVPNRKVLDKAIEDGDLSKVEKMIQAFSPDKIAEINAFKARFVETLMNPLSTKRLSDVEKVVVDKFQKTMTRLNKQYYDTLTPDEQQIVTERIKKPKVLLTLEQDAVYERFLRNNEADVDLIRTQLDPEEEAIIEKVLTMNNYLKTSARTGRLTINPKRVIIGSGAGRSRGRPAKVTTRPKMKVGQGLKAETLPTNVEFGKYALNTRQLKKQILSLKSKSGGSLTWFQATPISDAFTEMLHEMISGKGLNKHILKTLDKDEQGLFYEVADRAGLADQFQLVKPKDTKEEDIKKRFDVLLGMYKAGNNNPSLIVELRKHIIYYTNKGKIPKAKSLAMLLELS